jgi:uncharacterized protein (TIGR02266 family)
MHDSPSEKQSSVRLDAQLRIYFGDDQSKLLTGYSIDLNAGGIFLATTCPFAVDDIVTLQFSIPGSDEKVACKARVAWINSESNRLKPQYPTGVGLQFIGLTEENLQSILSCLELEAAW